MSQLGRNRISVGQLFHMKGPAHLIEKIITDTNRILILILLFTFSQGFLKSLGYITTIPMYIAFNVIGLSYVLDLVANIIRKRNRSTKVTLRQSVSRLYWF